MNEEITTILIAIARVEEKIDSMNKVQMKHLEMDKEIHVDHENRIRTLEASKWRAQGTAVFLAGLVSATVAYLFKHGGH